MSIVDLSGFLQAKYSPASRVVSVEGLFPKGGGVDAVAGPSYEGDGDPAGWRVRGLTGNELATVNEAEQRNKKEAALLEALDGASHSRIVSEMKAALGKDGATRPDVARRLEILVLGSVDPKCTEQVAVKLCEVHPYVFFNLTNTILELTGQGSDVEKKPGDSIETGS